tara:strand:+ start:41 stop:679 length:639 start_codon:yes stop_codon:yes gene_type:complete
MKIFLDALELDQIKKYSNMGILSGVTTNPTLAKKHGMLDDIDMIEKIREVMPVGEIHVEAWGKTKDEILNNITRLKTHSNDPDLVYKIPFSPNGIEACNTAILNGDKTNMHLIFSHNQAIICDTVNSTYICPLVGRLDDIGHDALSFISELTKVIFFSNIMVSSVRHPMHVIKASKVGANVITVPLKVLEQMFEHPLTTTGIELFEKDIQSM